MKPLQTVFRSMIAAVALQTFSACSLMHEELDLCPQGLSVEFVYDYNFERADMFSDHVGSVTLYVYDEAGRLVRTQTEDNSAAAQPLRDRNYRMRVEGLQPGEYHLRALANQRSYNELAATPGVRYLRTEGQMEQDLRVELLQNGNAVTECRQALDTLWYGTLRSAERTANPVTRISEETIETAWEMVEAASVSVVEGELTHCVVRLMRDTKRLHISLRQSDNPAHCDIADYDITITDHNGRLLWDNGVDPACPQIVYRPFDEWNTYYSGTTGQSYYERPTDTDDVEEAAHADIDFNRLMIRDASSTIPPAFLKITNRASGQVVAYINLPEILAQGRGAFERINYSPQGFLDRAYDYRLDFILKGGEWQFMSLAIHTLPWVLRIQREDLK